MARKIRERQTDRIPSGGIAPTRGNLTAWEILEAAIVDVLPALPDGAVTIAALAARLHTTESRASQILRATPGLKALRYRRENGRPSVCYVPKVAE